MVNHHWTTIFGIIDNFCFFSKHRTCKSKQRLTYAWQQTDAEVKVYIPFDQSEDTWMSAILDFFRQGKNMFRPKDCLRLYGMDVCKPTRASVVLSKWIITPI